MYTQLLFELYPTYATHQSIVTWLSSISSQFRSRLEHARTTVKRRNAIPVSNAATQISNAFIDAIPMHISTWQRSPPAVAIVNIQELALKVVTHAKSGDMHPDQVFIALITKILKHIASDMYV
jgi:hypothetical protein